MKDATSTRERNTENLQKNPKRSLIVDKKQPENHDVSTPQSFQLV